MILTKGKVLLKFTETKKSSIIQLGDSKDTTKLFGDFSIIQIGSECEDVLKVGQIVTMREQHYKIPVELVKGDAKNKIYHFIVDHSEIWGCE